MNTQAETNHAAPGTERGAALEDMMADPSAHFKSPDQVLEMSNLADAEKVEILRAWEVDARQLMAAAEENMLGGEDANLESVLSALKSLGLGPMVQSGGSKVGG